MSLILSDRLSPAQIDQLVALYQTVWWGVGRTRPEVERMLSGCDLVFALSEPGDDSLAAFARVLTDFTYKALIFDVIVRADLRGSGAGRGLLDALLGHPRLASVEHIELYCAAEHVEFYRKWGFETAPERLNLMRLSRRP